jgi:hypothetical protein
LSGTNYPNLVVGQFKTGASTLVVNPWILSTNLRRANGENWAAAITRGERLVKASTKAGRMGNLLDFAKTKGEQTKEGPHPQVARQKHNVGCDWRQQSDRPDMQCGKGAWSSNLRDEDAHRAAEKARGTVFGMFLP